MLNLDHCIYVLIMQIKFAVCLHRTSVLMIFCEHAIWREYGNVLHFTY